MIIRDYLPYSRLRLPSYQTHRADAIYLNLTDGQIEDSEEVADGIIVDYDAEGRIIGLEILDASMRTGDPNVLSQFAFELPTIG